MQSNQERKALIVRFSSLGDILQCFPAAQHLKAQGYELHWLTREDFKEVVALNPFVDRIFGFSRKLGLLGLLKLALGLRKEPYDLIYDAHNNLRSHLVCLILRPFCNGLIRRKKFRLKRYLLFRWHKNLFGGKVVGRETYTSPLGHSHNEFAWNLALTSENYVALVPGAAWPLKVWPLEYWLSLISRFPSQKFIILGGESDQICFEIEKAIGSPRVQNWAGKLSYAESIKRIAQAQAVVSNDTGLLHAADLLKKPTIALIGPSAFGYPGSKTSTVLETELWCKPCSKDGRGRCKNNEYLKCLNDISPEKVSETLEKMIS